MATALLGSLQEFQPDNAMIKDYLERVQLYIEANAIPEGRQRAVLLSIIGSKIYAVLSDLLAPALPREKTFVEISAVLKQYFELKRVVIAERFHFHNREQQVGESMADYEAALRRLATNCRFGEFLQQALRDRFVCGLRNEAIQRRLLSEKELTHTKAMELAQAMEAADQNAKSLKAAEPYIHQFSAPSPLPAPSPCHRCGRKNYKPQDCHFREATCDICGKKGHISTVCRSRTQGGGQRRPRMQRRHDAKWVASERDAAKGKATDAAEERHRTSTDEFHLFKVNERTSGPMLMEVCANGKLLPLEIDTGGRPFDNLRGDKEESVSCGTIARLVPHPRDIHR